MIKIGFVAAIYGVISLYMTFGSSFGDCFKSECNERAYSVAMVIALLILLLGMVLIFVGTVKLVKNEPRKKYWLVVIILVYSLLGFGSYYYFFGGHRYFESKSFISNFGTTYYTAGYLPDGYSEGFTIYSANGDVRSAYGQGNYASTTYRKTLQGDNGQTYFEELSIEQGDKMNNAAGVLVYCGKTYECDVVDGQNVKGIQCQRVNTYLCSVVLEGTYISVNGKKLSREDAVFILDSLVPK